MKKFNRVLIILLSIFIVWALLAPFLANILIVKKPLQRADAIWVLSGSSTYIERNREAAHAYKKGVAAKIFLTNDGGQAGWSQSEQRNPPFVELAKGELIEQGVPNEAIEILPKLVEGTNYEADLFAETAQKHNFKSVLLVTSAYHSRRTLWTFNRAVLNNNLSVEIGLQSPSKTTLLLSPSDLMFVGEEYVKMAYYWLFY